MSIGIRVDLVGFQRAQSVLQKLTVLQLKDLLDNVGNMVANQTRTRIQHTKKAPDGGAWPRLDPDYEKRKATLKPGVGMLEFDQDLRDSLTHNVIGSTEVEIGSNRPYAAVHQLGSPDGFTPARPYLGISQQNSGDLDDMINVWIKRRTGLR